MKSFYTLGVAAGFAILAAGFSAPASAAPVAPGAVRQALGDAPSDVIQVRRGGRYVGGYHGGGRRWVHRGPVRGWHGGPRRYGYGWYGGRRYYGGWGWGAPLVVAPFAAAPYYGNDCGYVSVRRWVNGRRIWVRRYQCW